MKYRRLDLSPGVAMAYSNYLAKAQEWVQQSAKLLGENKAQDHRASDAIHDLRDQVAAMMAPHKVPAPLDLYEMHANIAALTASSLAVPHDPEIHAVVLKRLAAITEKLQQNGLLLYPTDAKPDPSGGPMPVNVTYVPVAPISEEEYAAANKPAGAFTKLIEGEKNDPAV